ncbi:MAG: hypothetical protein RRB13_12865 [bacterium]|nr:hypothetical protein [bacterium]
MSRSLLEAFYHRLMGAYGPQGWWPLFLSSSGPLYHKGDASFPQNDQQRLEICLGAILTQNTSWNNVVMALEQVGRQGLLDLNKLAELPPEALGPVIRSAGYFNQKARYLGNLARFLLQHPFEQLRQMPTDQARKALLSVSGVGQETADSILLYALDHPVFVIDAYSRRIFKALGFCAGTEPYDQLAAQVMAQFPPDLTRYREYHGLLVEHAKHYYQKKPYPELDPLAPS